MTNFFTADLHWHHSNIIKYCNRPFQTIEEMHEKMIYNWNQVVKNGDIVYHLGDWGFIKSAEAFDAPKDCVISVESRLNGKIILFRGNHDKNNHVKTIITSMVVIQGGQRLWLTHDPKDANPNYYINLVGHVHKKWTYNKLSKNSYMINVGVDVWDYRPITINQILNGFNSWRKENNV